MLAFNSFSDKLVSISNVQNLNLGFILRSCAVEINTASLTKDPPLKLGVDLTLKVQNTLFTYPA